MNDKLFLIAIGGTGMRCLESFVHLCAAGLFDSHTIDILTIDTDQNNGNKDRVENLINIYNKVKTHDPNNFGGEARTDTYFSAKLNLYKFYTDYSTTDRKKYHLLATKSQTEETISDNQDISDLFFEKDSVQQFDLEHGYRAQTHLGSMLMYHGIIEAAINVKKGGQYVKAKDQALADYLLLLNKHAANARVFVLGSVFGGTGASSIPVFPLAVSEALKVLTGGTNEINTSKVLFGSTLLTDYFTFKSPNDVQKSTQKVIADANNFALNSQAAMSFYNDDATVRFTYKRMYHIGWPTSCKADYSKEGDSTVITGGRDQRNDCHVAELMCAAAAYDFFNEERSTLENITEAEYRFRVIEVDDSSHAMLFKGASFVGSNGEKFENKLGSFLTFAHLILSCHEGAYSGANGVDAFLSKVQTELINYSDISAEQCAEINEYLKEFCYRISNDKVEPGWIFQVKNSVRNGSFIFSPEAFKATEKELMKIDIGKIFGDYREWSPRLKSSYDTLGTKFKADAAAPYEGQGDTAKELFLARMYNTIDLLINHVK